MGKAESAVQGHSCLYRDFQACLKFRKQLAPLSLSVLSTTASTGVGVGPKLLPRELPESKQRLAVIPPTPASLRLPSLVLVKEEISLLLVYNITEHVRKNNPGAHQDLNDCKIQSQVTWEHKGTMCGIHVNPEQQLLLPNLQGQARPRRG